MDNNNLLTKDDIEVRVARTLVYDNAVKAEVLIYKNARVDMSALDQIHGPMNWRRSHRILDGRLYCIVEVYDKEKKEWIAKEDVGTESNTEPEKGQASDAFKRACFNWGIGRELYTAPRIIIALTDKEYIRSNGNVRVTASFHVSEIGYDEKRSINRLVIADRFNNVRFELGAPSASAPAEAPAPAPKKTAEKPAPAAKKTAQANDYLQGGKYYQKTVEYAAQGKTAKSGEDYRTAWIRLAKPTDEQLEAFDRDVTTYRLNNNIQPAF